jgi:hypothetical protein
VDEWETTNPDSPFSSKPSVLRVGVLVCYDNFGNRTGELEANAACPSSLIPGNTTHWVSYTPSNGKPPTNQIVSSDTGTPIYDAAGNVIQDAQYNYLYDAEGRICAVEGLQSTSAIAYFYDAEGQRVAKGFWSGPTWPTTGGTWTSHNPAPACPLPTDASASSSVSLTGGRPLR